MPYMYALPQQLPFGNVIIDTTKITYIFHLSLCHCNNQYEQLAATGSRINWQLMRVHVRRGANSCAGVPQCAGLDGPAASVSLLGDSDNTDVILVLSPRARTAPPSLVSGVLLKAFVV